MSRFVLAALALATLALPGARASAEDCMCVGPDGIIQLASALEGPAMDAPEALESPDDTIETVDPTAPVVVAVPRAPARRGPIAWCRSANDPRCQRDDSGESPHRTTLAAAAAVVLLPSMPRIPAPTITIVRFGREIAQGPSGIHVRLERPPRA